MKKIVFVSEFLNPPFVHCLEFVCNGEIFNYKQIIEKYNAKQQILHQAKNLYIHEESNFTKFIKRISF